MGSGSIHWTNIYRAPVLGPIPDPWDTVVNKPL